MSETRILRTGQTSHYAALFESLAPSRSTEPDWLRALRSDALSRFLNAGFPLPKDEEWRFTPIGPIAETPFRPAGTRDAAFMEHPEVDRLAGLGGPRIVVANGRYVAIDDPRVETSGLWVGSLREALSRGSQDDLRLLGSVAVDGPSLTALNTALFEDCLVIRVPDDYQSATPIEIVFATEPEAEPTVVSPRLLVVVGQGSRVTLVERYIGLEAGVYWSNPVTEVVVGERANVDHYRLQHEAGRAYHTARTAVWIAGEATYTSYSVQMGATIARHDLGARFTGEDAECYFYGLFIGNGSQLVDNHTVIDHALPNCVSFELYKGILNDRAHGVFNGKVFVRPHAQKTDAKQSNRTLLLSDAAHMDSKPQLEIFADDVRCTHGATVGHVDDDSLFYLRSRGISADDARAILVHAFAEEVLERMELREVRRVLEENLLTSLPKPSEVFVSEM